MGSSTLMMCSLLVWLILSIIAASVVDLPLPVAPVTSTRPRGLSVMRSTTPSNPSSMMPFISSGTVRNPAPRAPFWKYTLTLKRAVFGTEKEKSSS